MSVASRFLIDGTTRYKQIICEGIVLFVRCRCYNADMASEQDKTSGKRSPWLLASWLMAAVVLAAILCDQSYALPAGLVAFSLLLPLVAMVLAVEFVRRFPRRFSLREVMIVLTLMCVYFACCAAAYRILVN